MFQPNGFQPNETNRERRRDTAMASAVDEAIRFDRECGAALAWAYLASHGLAPETILRVLSQPPSGTLPRRQEAH